VHHGAARVDDAVAVAVVGDVEQRVHEGAVGGGDPFLHRRAVEAAQVLADDERALGPGGHDHGVLDHLRLDQPEHLGPEVLRPLRPAQPTPGHGRAPQVQPLHPR
jgi:hypothetical protein